jgi:hypothetical protein
VNFAVCLAIPCATAGRWRLHATTTESPWRKFYGPRIAAHDTAADLQAVGDVEWGHSLRGHALHCFHARGARSKDSFHTIHELAVDRRGGHQ